MNPSIINTANVLQFGFTATFDLENSQLIFDISTLTIFKSGGAANVQGINFQVVDPSGSYLSTIDFPNVDINPADGQTSYAVGLTSSASQFGYYNIMGVLREQNGQDYTIVQPAINICRPPNQVNGAVPGVFQEIIDCSLPTVGATELTNMTYLSKAPISIEKNGMFYYPQGTLEPVAFSYTPFQVFGSGKVYTGDYTVRNKSRATYDLGNQFFVIVTYATSFKFTVNCTSNLCNILCCIQQLQQLVSEDCGSVAAGNARKKLDEVTIPLVMALTMEKCGTNAGQLVDSIAQTLGCDCNCDGQLVEPKPIYTTFDPVVLNGQCATTAFLDANGIWQIKTRTISVVKEDPSLTALTITSKETDCNVAWEIGLNENILTGDILNIIKNSPEYRSILNSLIEIPGLDLTSIGANCVVDLSKNNYTMVTDASTVGRMVTNIVIDGTIFLAPAGINVTNATGIANWLNSLNKGVWTVTYDSGTSPATTVISTLNNTSTISTMAFTLNGATSAQQFSKSGITVTNMFKAIIDYLCGLSENKIKLGTSYIICSLQPNGEIKQEQVTPTDGKTLADLFTMFAASFCSSLQNIKQLAGITCQAVQGLFINQNQPIMPTDVLYGTRNKMCGAWSIEDTVRAVYSFLNTTNKQDIIDLLCQVNSRCVLPTCAPVQFMTIELIEPCPGVSSITGSFTS